MARYLSLRTHFLLAIGLVAVCMTVFFLRPRLQLESVTVAAYGTRARLHGMCIGTNSPAWRLNTIEIFVGMLDESGESGDMVPMVVTLGRKIQIGHKILVINTLDREHCTISVYPDKEFAEGVSLP